jgi:hypothetical protein
MSAWRGRLFLVFCVGLVGGRCYGDVCLGHLDAVCGIWIPPFCYTYRSLSVEVKKQFAQR